MFYSVSSNTRTNLSPSQIVKIGLRLKPILSYGQIDMGTIPGGDAQLSGGYYMLSNSIGKKKVIDEVVFGKKLDLPKPSKHPEQRRNIFP
jgi:anionic cell wall polymer biosynthesis LytR-Cps2A-Psr (LCP) family protein